MPATRLIFTLCLSVLAGFGIGCQSKYSNLPKYQASIQPLSVDGLSEPQADAAVDAMVIVPAGWKAEPFKGSDQHAHQVWLSPTGKTAYGVIHFGLPLPVPARWILNSFLSEMKKSEGEATVIGQPMEDDALPGVRFMVDCGDYRMRINLICKGFRGWAVYAGTLRAQEEVPSELELAERAREKTKVGLPQAAAPTPPSFTRPTASIAE
jgi:hypothetical protein